MCLIGIRIANGSRWPIVIAANRDETHARPTDPAAWWPDEGPAILAGRDRLAGGSWLGIGRVAASALATRPPAHPQRNDPSNAPPARSAQGLRIAALTNVRPGLMPTAPAIDTAAVALTPRSRGLLVAGWLRAEATANPIDWLNALSNARDRYPGFNLVAIEGRPAAADPRTTHPSTVRSATALHWQAAVLSNAGQEPAAAVSDGLLLVTNGRIEERWPKSRRLGDAFGRIRWNRDDPGSIEHGDDAVADEEAIASRLLAALADRQEAPPGTQPPTGLPPERERALSSVFIADAHYGTRASTVILVRADGHVRFIEQTFGPGGTPGVRVDRSFDALVADGRGGHAAAVDPSAGFVQAATR